MSKIIIHSNTNDFSSQGIIYYLKKYNADYFLLNDNIYIEKISDKCICLSNAFSEKYQLDITVHTIYYNRQGEINIDKEALNIIERKSIQEQHSVREYLIIAFKRSICPEKRQYVNRANYINKLDVFNEAKKIGLLVPMYILTTAKNDLVDFYKTTNGNVICKSITPGVQFEDKDFFYQGLTVQITDALLENTNEKFQLSFFQELIYKKFEIRLTVWNKNFYAIAFYYEKCQDKTDVRIYVEEKAFPITSFNLPDNIKKMILKLMDHFGLFTCSFDIIYSMDKQFYLIDVNPEGQLSFLSTLGNYNIESLIAKDLIKWN